MMRCRRFSLSFLLALIVGCSLGWQLVAAEDQASPSSRASELLARLQAETGTPAVSGAVALRGRIVFSSGAGMIDLENGVPATGKSVYDIGSVSKIITAIAVMQMVEQGLVSLDDDIRKYVPEFPDKGATITVRHILTHTSGIRHYHSGDFPGTPGGENVMPASSFKDGLPVFAKDPLLFKPGAFYFYTSYAVNLLEGVMERASGKKFEEYLRERVWGPAGMTTAAFDVPSRIVPNRARSYRLEDGKWLNEHHGDLGYKYASGGMIASVEDLALFGAAVNENKLVTASTRRQMFTPQIPGLLAFHEDGKPTAAPAEQGLLWRLMRDHAGRRIAYHCGSVSAFNACVVDFYEEDLVAAIATNSWSCCGWSKAIALAALFRSDGHDQSEPPANPEHP